MYVRSKIPAANLVRLLHARLCTVHILHGSKTCKIIARSCKIVATSLAICKIFEQVYKILLQDVSDFDASQPASFLQEPYVWDVPTIINHFIAYSPTVPLLEGQSRFLVQNLLLSRFFLLYFCTLASLSLNLIILTVFIEFLRMSRF